MQSSNKRTNSEQKRTVTIPRNLSFDPYHRYRRIVLEVTWISKHGGTSVVSSAEFRILAHQLGRKEEVLQKYIRQQLGAPINFVGDQLHMRTKITSHGLDDIIEKFVLEKILCGTCDNPETILASDGNSWTCKACGAITNFDQ